MELAIMQRENELERLTVDGKRTDDGTRCTLLLVSETGGVWALYLHGATRLGVRIAKAQAVKLAQSILADNAE